MPTSHVHKKNSKNLFKNLKSNHFCYSLQFIIIDRNEELSILKISSSSGLFWLTSSSIPDPLYCARDASFYSLFELSAELDM